jgi:DNA-binding GntR family transcriptional regulator
LVGATVSRASVEQVYEAFPDDLPRRTNGTLADRLFDDLLLAITRGELAPGSKISEPVLARRYGVSRGTLREALNRLQERKLVTRLANQGARVVQQTPRALSDLFEVREALEGMAVRQATLRCTADDLDALHETIVRFEAQLDSLTDEEPYMDVAPDRDFHFLIAQISQNPYLVSLLCAELYPLLRVYRASTAYPRIKRREAAEEHKRILAAMEGKDAELAEMLMRRHISAANRRRQDVLSRPSR